MSNPDVQLALYNEALELLGSRPIQSLSEDREPTRILDAIWNTNLPDTCLEMGQWQFASRISSLTYSPSVSPSFGYAYAFEKPDDIILLVRLCWDDQLKLPLTDYVDEAQFWFAHLDTLYLQYVSNDAQYGGDYSLWPESFKRYVAATMARRAAPRLTQDKMIVEHVQKEEKHRLMVARNRDAIRVPTRFPPDGTWISARRGRTATNRERA